MACIAKVKLEDSFNSMQQINLYQSCNYPYIIQANISKNYLIQNKTT
jgi:hypothetical protein